MGGFTFLFSLKNEKSFFSFSEKKEKFFSF